MAAGVFGLLLAGALLLLGGGYALAGTVNGLFRAEVIHRRGPWRGMEATGFATLEWVGRFNTRHPPEPTGNTPPAGAEARYCAQTEAQALAA